MNCDVKTKTFWDVSPTKSGRLEQGLSLSTMSRRWWLHHERISGDAPGTDQPETHAWRRWRSIRLENFSGSRTNRCGSILKESWICLKPRHEDWEKYSVEVVSLIMWETHEKELKMVEGGPYGGALILNQQDGGNHIEKRTWENLKFKIQNFLSWFYIIMVILLFRSSLHYFNQHRNDFKKNQIKLKLNWTKPNNHQLIFKWT